MANQIECPVCGVMIEIDDNSGSNIECTNCHEIVTNNYASKIVENKKNANYKQSQKAKTRNRSSHLPSDYTIIEGDSDYRNHSTENDGLAIDTVSTSKYDEEGVKKELVNTLVETDYVPADIFECLHIEDVRKYYLPYQLFKGTYQVPWYATYQWYEYVDYVENGERKSMRQKRYGESNGIANGEFSFLCLVCDGDNIPPKLFEKAKKKSSLLEKVVSYSSDIIDDHRNVVVMPNSSFEFNWKERVVQDVLSMGKVDAEKQARSYEGGSFTKAIGTGASLQSCNYQVNYDLSELETILVPFWHVGYSYQDKHYWFVMDGGGRHKEIEAPKDEEEMAVIEENEKKKTGCLWNAIILLLLVSSVIAGWMCGSWLIFLGIAALGLGVAYMAFHNDEKVDNLNKEVRNENKKRRQELAHGFLNNLPEGGKSKQLKMNKKNENVKETKEIVNDDYLDSIV